jgi:hypothetical protein
VRTLYASGPDADRWLESELHVAELLREAAELEEDRRAHRLALVALGRAERALERADRRVARWPTDSERAEGIAALTQERQRLTAARATILARMEPSQAALKSR